MGLSVAYSLVEAHGGAMSGRNNPETGATFTMRLPALERKAAVRALIGTMTSRSSRCCWCLAETAATRWMTPPVEPSSIPIGTRMGRTSLVLDVLMPEMDGAESAAPSAPSRNWLP